MKILYGICGIGNGHVFRQLPGVARALQDGHQVVLFGYQNSYAYFKSMEQRYSNLRVLPVAVPYLVGNKDGLDLSASLELNINDQSYFQINTRAMQDAKKILGTPDLVITDYEPTAAQYAYMTGAPLHTFDQQSKFLFGDFPAEINGCTFAEEVERLRLFFPKANKRIIASFFDFKLKNVPDWEDIVVVPPPMSERTRAIKARADMSSRRREILVYLSPQMPPEISTELVQRLLSHCASWTDQKFHCYFPSSVQAPLPKLGVNITLNPIGSSSYDDHLAGCAGIITTAGHGLLSEAVFLEKSVLAISLNLYEQQLNGHMIEEMGHGVHTTARHLSSADVDRFLEGISERASGRKKGKYE